MIVLIDLVDTLGHRQWMPVGQSPVPRDGWQIVWSFDRGKYAYWRLRPSAIPFVEALRAKCFEVNILSSSKEEETAAFVEEAGMRGLFLAIYGRDSQIPVPKCPWILVDNRDPEAFPEPHPGPHYKVLQVVGLNQLQQEAAESEVVSRMLIARHFVQSSTYTGEGEDACPLTNLLPEIESKLARQAKEDDTCE
jgi:hypothetical protein